MRGGGVFLLLILALTSSAAAEPVTDGDPRISDSPRNPGLFGFELFRDMALTAVPCAALGVATGSVYNWCGVTADRFAVPSRYLIDVAADRAGLLWLAGSSRWARTAISPPTYTTTRIEQHYGLRFDITYVYLRGRSTVAVIAHYQ